MKVTFAFKWLVHFIEYVYVTEVSLFFTTLTKYNFFFRDCIILTLCVYGEMILVKGACLFFWSHGPCSVVCVRKPFRQPVLFNTIFAVVYDLYISNVIWKLNLVTRIHFHSFHHQIISAVICSCHFISAWGLVLFVCSFSILRGCN